MNRKWLLALILAGSPVAALADGMTMPHPAVSGSASDKAYAAAMASMMRDMDAKPTGDADRDFVTMMLPHHRGAVDMARVELRYGKDPQLLALARAIVVAQDKEIAEMSEWQAKHGR